MAAVFAGCHDTIVLPFFGQIDAPEVITPRFSGFPTNDGRTILVLAQHLSQYSDGALSFLHPKRQLITHLLREDLNHFSYLAISEPHFNLSTVKSQFVVGDDSPDPIFLIQEQHIPGVVANDGATLPPNGYFLGAMSVVLDQEMTILDLLLSVLM
jgi:hypothetical protein